MGHAYSVDTSKTPHRHEYLVNTNKSTPCCDYMNIQWIQVKSTHCVMNIQQIRITLALAHRYLKPNIMNIYLIQIKVHTVS